ncbi:hypothetical protein FSP39_012441 [Pinctada imbricata]|uniref:Uncharacterized protein n=1 Tax=Pinctada imbricata TaxID=66713 RepID=A0AA88XLB1_PINIB|nr:hypothetical protein FSP39_012441 [Pinctada imbricata]
MAERSFGQSRFYESLNSESNIQFNDVLERDKELKSLRPSKQLPKWIWRLLVHILGIKRTGEKRVPCLSIVLQGIFLLLACTFTITGMVHTVYDIQSKYSQTTLVIGCVNILIGFGWIALGIYSQKLAAKLFTNRNFAESVRIHSRTFFKISAAGLLLFLSTGAVALNCYNDFSIFGPNHCDKIFLHQAVCHVMYGSHVAFSVMSLVWNVLVGCVLLSVCRTHTIGIRRFIKQLEDDAKILDNMVETDQTHMNFMSASHGENSEWFIWDDSINRTDLEEAALLNNGPPNKYLPPRELQSSVSTAEAGDSETLETADNRDQENENDEVKNKEDVEEFSSEKKKEKESPRYLTEGELLNSYWKISNRMRITSQYLQRWFASWSIFMFIWCADFIVYWLSNSATIIDILEFSIPLMLLFILTVAYAECNGEGQRMIRVFSFSVTYNTIFGVVLAFVVAFASRIILDELNRI